MKLKKIERNKRPYLPQSSFEKIMNKVHNWNKGFWVLFHWLRISGCRGMCLIGTVGCCLDVFASEYMKLGRMCMVYGCFTSKHSAGEQHVVALLVRAERRRVDDASPSVHHHRLLRRNCRQQQQYKHFTLHLSLPVCAPYLTTLMARHSLDAFSYVSTNANEYSWSFWVYRSALTGCGVVRSQKDKYNRRAYRKCDRYYYCRKQCLCYPRHAMPGNQRITENFNKTVINYYDCFNHAILFIQTIQPQLLTGERGRDMSTIT